MEKMSEFWPVYSSSQKTTPWFCNYLRASVNTKIRVVKYIAVI